MKSVSVLGLVWLVVGCNGTSFLGDGAGGDSGVVGQGGSAGAVGTGGSGGAWSPCAGLACGTSCNLAACPQSQQACPAIYAQGYCDQNGTCTQNQPQCTVENPCTGKACGDTCTPPCPAGQACPAVLGYCGENGSCTLAYPVCSTSPTCQLDTDCPAPPPAPCQQCSNNTAVCYRASCVNGECAYVMPGCPSWDPCAGRACGDACSPCNPADPACAVPATPMYCNANLGCQVGEPACGDGYGSCGTVDDCPRLPYPCRLCGGGGTAPPCGGLTCLGGACLLTCPL
jgi:hypothetical protein